MSDRIATTEAPQEGFYWVILGQNRRRKNASSMLTELRRLLVAAGLTAEKPN